MTSEGHGEARWFTPGVFARLAAARYLQPHAMPLVSEWPATFELNGFLFDLPERTTACSVVVRSRPLADAVTNRIIPTGMVSRVDRAISPLSPARTRIRRLANRRKIQTRAASRVGGQQRGPQR